MNIGENIKTLRLSAEMSQEQLAEKVGVTQPMIAQIERGTKAVSLQLGKAIADVLECSVNDLF
jgi:transcriptional regulator with XRE-family HTH domain